MSNVGTTIATGHTAEGQACSDGGGALRVPEAKLENHILVSGSSEGARLQRDLELAAIGKRRKQESAYYLLVRHPLEKLASSKTDKSGAPIRENYVKLQVVTNERERGRRGIYQTHAVL